MARTEELLIVNIDGRRVLMTQSEYDRVMTQWYRNRMGSSQAVQNNRNSRLANIARRGRERG